MYWLLGKNAVTRVKGLSSVFPLGKLFWKLFQAHEDFNIHGSMNSKNCLYFINWTLTALYAYDMAVFFYILKEEHVPQSV